MIRDAVERFVYGHIIAKHMMSRPLRRSELITRKQLALVSGGKGDEENLLKLATPISSMGGAAIATKKGLLSHIVIKEFRNVPLPATECEEYILNCYGTSPSRDVLLMQRQLQSEGTQPSVPFFWEPQKQPGG